MTDPIDRLIAMRERIEALIAEEERKADKLDRVELYLLLADALAVLRDVSTDNMSEGKRARVTGVRERLRRALA